MEDRYAKKWRALIGISLLSIPAFLDYSIINTVLPGIQADLLASVSQLQWIMNAFFMGLAMFMVTVGRIGDIVGRRLVLYIGAILFGAASIGAGLAENANFLIACRAVQGLGAAIGLTCGASLVTHAFPKEEEGRALGMFMAVTAIGMAVGPLLGGFFLSFLSWRWAFFVNVPVILIAFAIARGAVTETPRLTEEKIDWLGLSLLVPAIGGLVLVIMQGNSWGWLSPTMLTLYAATLIITAGFVLIERRVASPIIDFSLFRIPLFQIGVICALGLGGFIGIGTFLPPLFLINIQGYPAYLAGLMLLPITCLVMLLPSFVGRVVDNVGPALFLIVGQVFLVAAALIQSQFTVESPAWLVLIGMALFGLGWGVQQGATGSAATQSVPQEAAGLALGTLWTFFNIGSAAILSAAGVILDAVDKAQLEQRLAEANITLTAHEQHTIRSLLADPSKAEQLLGELPGKLSTEIAPLFHESFVAGYNDAMLFVAAYCAVAFVASLIISRRLPRKEKAEPEA